MFCPAPALQCPACGSSGDLQARFEQVFGPSLTRSLLVGAGGGGSGGGGGGGSGKAGKVESGTMGRVLVDVLVSDPLSEGFHSSALQVALSVYMQLQPPAPPFKKKKVGGWRERKKRNTYFLSPLHAIVCLRQQAELHVSRHQRKY